LEAAMTHEKVPVLIVGGSLVGLSTAVFLGHHGVPSLVLERHRGTAIHPRAALVNQRTMENYRAVGLEEEIEDAADREFVQNGAIVSVDSLGGKELDWYFRFINEGVEHLSPSKRVFITQIGLEPVLLRAAERLGAEIRYASEAASVEQDGSGVTVVVRSRDGGSDQRVRARYLIAADGAHSPIRERLGIRQLGHGSFSDSITIYFKADVRRLMGDRNLSVVYVFGPRLQGFFRFSIDLQAGFLVVNSTVDEDGTRSVRIGEDMSEPSCIRYVREALGDPELDVEIENVQRWSASAEYAERMRDGRVFIAGDAAHVMPPTGGFGGNCGVQDGYDLAWKLAHVLNGRADEALLATYDAERQPVGAFTTEQAYTRYVLRLDPSLGKDDLMPIVGEAPIELGYRHRSSAVLGADDDAMWEDPGEPSGRPGFRAPHLPVRVGGLEQSTLDLFGRDFVLLCGSDGDSWCAAARAAGDASGVPVTEYRFGADVTDASGGLETAYGTGPAGAVLVRPDGFIAWRAIASHGDPEGELAGALGAALGRGAAVTARG
jgi:2-polyprenyl-6-methoxyphenol hydroxylase-like FAD-dependent oxidoreductase